MSVENTKTNTLTDEEVAGASGGGTNDWMGKGFNLKVGQPFRTKKPQTHDCGNYKCTSSDFTVKIDCYALGFVEAKCTTCNGSHILVQRIKYSDIENPN